MTRNIQAPRIKSGESPRQILTQDFKSLGSELPISGGWGYTLEDAVIIDKNDPVVPDKIPFDGVGLEYVFVEKRIYEELIIFRSKEEKCSDIKWNLQHQKLASHSDRWYDNLVFEVTALPDRDWKELKEEWGGPHGFGTPGFDMNAHAAKRDSRTIRYITEYWFDITSFYGLDCLGSKVDDNETKEDDANVLVNIFISEMAALEKQEPFVAKQLKLLRDGNHFEGMSTDFIFYLMDHRKIGQIVQDIYAKEHKPLMELLRDNFFEHDKVLFSLSDQLLIEKCKEELKKMVKEDQYVDKCLKMLRDQALFQDDDLFFEFHLYLLGKPISNILLLLGDRGMDFDIIYKEVASMLY